VSDESESVLVKLTRMEGKLDLSNLRHDQHDARFSAIDGRLNTHGDRISGLESREVGRDGERRGLTMAGRVVWAAVGLVPGGAIVAVIMKAFGAG
jgi:hypothetical protein